MKFLKVKSIIFDHLMTISLTAGIYYAWHIQGSEDFTFIITDILTIYIIAYLFQTIANVINTHQHSAGEYKAGIKLMNLDNTEPRKARVLFRHLVYPVILINAIWWPPFAFLLIVSMYLSLKQINENELIDGLTPLTKLKYAKIENIIRKDD